MKGKDRGGRALPARTLTVAVLLGVLAGIGGFTFHYAEGFSYFSADPAACANCHIMQPQYDSWLKGSHHAVATCVDCHLPRQFLAKYAAKAGNGYHHSKGFTFQDFEEPIRIKPDNARILQENRLACHGELTHLLVTGATTDPDAVVCVHCHRSVGHGPTLGIGGPDRGEERERREHRR
jgi:cytochrome c nitrite reductase small subunit